MSWPATKSTVIMVESVMEPGCDGGGIRDVTKKPGFSELTYSGKIVLNIGPSN